MESEQLNNALLKSAKDEEKSEEEAPRRNSKEDLIKKILEYAEKHKVEVEHSNTRLKRMTKKQLQEYYAFLVETVIRQNMAEQVGARKDATDKVIGLAALRMVHDICATTAESGLNTYLPAYGYEVNGFTDSLKQPQVSEAIDSCLEEIAADSDILQYIESPYTRLAIAWGGCLASTVRQRREINYGNRRVNRHVTIVEPQQTRKEDPVQLSFDRRPPHGQKHDGQRPSLANAKRV